MPILPVAPIQNFELVRDRIGQILADEFSAQSVTPVIYKERIVPFDKTDLNAINVVFSKGNFDSKTQIDRDGVHVFNVDCYVSAKTTSSLQGDVKANLLLQKTLGIVGYILSASQYNTLLFSRPFIKHTMVKSIQFANTGTNQDAISVVMGRVEFEVHVNENSRVVTPVVFGELHTTVKLEETDKGYVWSYTATLQS